MSECKNEKKQQEGYIRRDSSNKALIVLRGIMLYITVLQVI